jgi:hypothetical protein
MAMADLSDLSTEHRQISDAVCALYEARLSILRDYLLANIVSDPKTDYAAGLSDGSNRALRKFNTLFPEKA